MRRGSQQTDVTTPGAVDARCHSDGMRVWTLPRQKDKTIESSPAALPWPASLNHGLPCMPGGACRVREPGIPLPRVPSASQFPILSPISLSSQLYFGPSVTFGSHRQEGMGEPAARPWPGPLLIPDPYAQSSAYRLVQAASGSCLDLNLDVSHTSSFGSSASQLRRYSWRKPKHHMQLLARL